MSLFISKLLKECNFQALGNDINYSVFIHFTEIAKRLKTMTSHSIGKETYRSYIKIFSFYHIFFYYLFILKIISNISAYKSALFKSFIVFFVEKRDGRLSYVYTAYPYERIVYIYI